MSFRQALRHSRKIESGDATLDPMTKVVLDQQRKELLNIISRDVSLS